MFKKALSLLLSLVLIAMPFSSAIIFTAAAADGTLPKININIDPYAVIHQDTTVTVTITAQGGSTLASCDTRLEGTSLGTDSTVSFTPAAQGLTDGLYTLVVEATDSDGDKAFAPLTFTVSADAEPSYSITGNTVSSSSAVTYYEADALNFDALYGSSADGQMDPTTLKFYSASDVNDLRYTDDAVTAASVSGIPYQLFDVDLAGKTSGEVAVSYSGSTKAGERMAVKVFNPKTNNWDTIGTFIGTGSVSELVDVATYNTDGKLNVMAVLDYVSNGSDTMIWSTDPQHYTKFRDLNEYYYKIYQYAAELYQAGEAGYIFTTGDLVDDVPKAAVAPSQWEVSDKAMSYVEEVGMPNGLVSGNHDVNTFKSPDYSIANTIDYSLFAETFPADRYNNERWYGGSLNNNTSHYDLITIGNVDFIVLYLGYGLEATDETIAWANDVLKTYRHRTAIVATHQYLNAQQAVRDNNGRGELIYQTIVDPNPNVKMVICGHDDGSLMLEKTASDGRTFYEILSDYQFVEAEDASFYANEHYIGSVPKCCGDGYIRLMTVEGDSLSSITYSPVTDRYNPYGDREEFTIDLNIGTADRQFATYAFSAAVLGNETTATNTDRVAVVTNGTATAYSPVLYANAQAGNAPATPSAPYYAHSASSAPAVVTKVDVLNKLGLSNNTVVNQWTVYGNYASSPLNMQIDLNTTPYLYYSISQPADSNFTFAFINNNVNVPWLVFRDAMGDGAYMNSGNANWDSYQAREQYTTTSETGCIDMRKLVTNHKSSIWEIEQVTFYNSQLKDVTINYFFFGSAAVPSGNTPVDTEALEALVKKAQAIDTTPYTTASVNELTAAINAATSVSPYHSSVTSAYTRLANAIGALTKVKATINESSLTSVKNYTLNLSNFSTNANLNCTQTNDGFVLKLPATASQAWAAITSWNTYTVKPERGQVFMKLDVDAQSSWSIQLGITQGDKTANVSVNNGIENAFGKPGLDGYEGDFQGIYDISDALVENGFDPASTFTVSYMHLYIVGLGGGATFNHVELLTNAGDGVTDKSALQAAINRAGTYTQSLYTSASWSTVSTALSAAKTALSSTSLAEADLNLKAYALNNALDALVYAGSYPETAGSLLPADPANWVPSNAGEITATRTNGVTVIKNSTGYWPSETYTLDKPLRVFVKESRLVVDMTIGASASILLNIGDENWIKVNPYIGAVNGDVDLVAGTNQISVPLSEIAEFDGMTSVTIYKVRVFSVGEAANSAVTFRSMRIADYENYNWSDIPVQYGVAATPSNPYYTHCAPYAPEVANKVDLLTAAGLEAHHSFNRYQAIQNLKVQIDLNKTPYLYYSYAVPAGAKATFGIFSNNTYSPYFVYRDASTSGNTLGNGVSNFEAAGSACHVATSETGCIDMRTFLKDPAVLTWIVNGISLYNNSGKDVTFSYLFFGSAPTYVEQDVVIEDDSVKGDVDGDGALKTQDLREMVKELLRDNITFTAHQQKLADYNNDGKLTSADVRGFLKFLTQ